MSITLHRTGLIYRNPKPHLISRHAYFPSLALLPDGRIFAAFDLGSAFEAVDVRSHYALSHDDGLTWSEPQPVPVPVFAKPFSSTCRFSASPDGSLVGVGAVWDRSRPEEGLANPETGGFVETHPFLARADAITLQWQPSEMMRTPLPGPFEICSPIIFATNGDWLWPASTWKDWQGQTPNGMQAVVLHSADHGATWDSWYPVMDGRSSGLIHWEIKLAVFPDGKVLAMSWTHDTHTDTDRPVHFAVSEDGGRSFGPSQTTDLIGQTCSPLVLPDGRILSIYRRMDRPGLWAQLSEIHHGAWKNLNATVLWGGASHAEERDEGSVVQKMSSLRFGLPTGKLLPDGSALIAFWCVEDAVSVIRYFKLHFDL